MALPDPRVLGRTRPRARILCALQDGCRGGETACGLCYLAGVDIVLPLLASGADRYVRLQRPTMERFYRDLGTTWIYSRPDEMTHIERATAGLEGVRVLSDLELVPELKIARAVRRDVTRNWYQQQLIKLAAVANADTQFVLILDADVIAVREVSDRDMLRDGRAMHNREPVSAHPGWVSSSAAALRLDPLDYCALPTPAVLAHGAVLELADYALRAVRPRKAIVRAATVTPGLRRYLTTWRGRLLGALPWTEYQLYETFLVQTDRFDEYHYYSEDPLMFDNCVWRKAEFEAWTPNPSTASPTYFFSVVQEAARIPVDDIEQKLRRGGLLQATI
jgi:hypothetical protein